jgi:hypothetical protein
MANTSVDRDHVSRQELYRSIVEVNKEAALQRQKALVGVRMTVPVIGLGHGAYPNFMIVH